MKSFLNSLVYVFFIYFIISCSNNTEEETLLTHRDRDYLLKPETLDSNLNKEREYIVILGDVQQYTDRDENMNSFISSVNWLLGQQEAYNSIACILQVGDVTNFNVDEQWIRYYGLTKYLVRAGIPIFTCTGNHDYTRDVEGKIHDRNSSKINTYLSSFYSDVIIRSQYEPNHFENIIVKLPLNYLNIDLILLEFAPRKEVLHWVKEYVLSHPRQSFLLMTHEFLHNNGEIVDSNSYAEMHLSNTNSSWSTPLYISQNLLFQCPNIKVVVCGHNGFTALNTSLGIPIMMFNLQFQDNGGDSMILLWEFESNGDRIRTNVYKTSSRSFINTTLSDFTFFM